MSQYWLCKSSCVEPASPLGHSLQSWREEILILKGNIFALKWNNCDMFFFFKFKKNKNVLPAGMNLFWRFERKAVLERRKTWVRRCSLAFSTHVLTYQGAWLVWRKEILRVKGFKGIKLFFHLSQKEKKRGNKRGKENHLLCGDQMQTGILN